jgi:hypothetical protein
MGAKQFPSYSGWGVGAGAGGRGRGRGQGKDQRTKKEEVKILDFHGDGVALQASKLPRYELQETPSAKVPCCPKRLSNLPDGLNKSASPYQWQARYSYFQTLRVKDPPTYAVPAM